MPTTHEGLVGFISEQGIRDERLLAALRATDRAGFVPQGAGRETYRDRPIGLPENQTTSQPSLIARMVEAAHVGPEDEVLEIGTGFGYQTALLARLAAHVVSMERYAVLARAAQANLAAAGIDNAEVIVGDGWKGSPERAPFQAVIVSAAASDVPAALVEQLAEGGRMVIPVSRGSSDDVLLFKKEKGELVLVEMLTPARFVPLVRGEAS